MCHKLSQINYFNMTSHIDTYTKPIHPFQIKAILARKRESDRVALERVKERASREEQERTSRAVAGVNHLEIPAELAFIFSKLDGEIPIDTKCF